ncbi:MAG: protein kinase [Gemmatimonadetes bacterium]|nr:protein kinase [Gemmatimonadota bacterium]
MEELRSALGAAYVIERELGGGGMSRVFLAEETRFHRKVVVKLLSPELAAGLSAERFEREIGLAAGLQQANIVPVLSAGEAGGLPWYSMPFVEGETLRARLDRGRVPLEECVAILRDVGRALAYAHEHGVVHRDIKPENILLSGGAAVVTDFGIAKAVTASRKEAPGGTLTVVGTSVGTPAYMAPEQAAGDDVDHRADIYSWSVLAYELLAGSHPFAGKKGAQQLMAAHIAERPRALREVAPGVPASLAATVMRGLEKDREARPASASLLVEQLGRVGTEPPQRKVRSVWPSVTVAVVLGVALVAWVVRRERAPKSGEGATPGSVSTLAVLPFVNTGGDAKDEYFSDGMTDELANALGKVDGLRIAGRSSSFAFKGKSMTAVEIGKALDVQALVEGTVRRAGNRLRITAQLTSATDGKAIWTNSYERAATEGFEVQDELTAAIMSALAPALRGGAAKSMASESRGTANADAYDLYLRGRYFFAKRGVENLVRAVGYFRQSVTKDPAFARAHAALAMTYGVMPFWMDDPADTLFGLAVASAQRALSLDSLLADAHMGMSVALSTHGQPLEALPHERAALMLAPENATAHQWHGVNLLELGRADSAVAELQRAVQLDPLSTVMHDDLASALGAARRFEEANAVVSRVLELNGHPLASAEAVPLLFGGNPDGAVALMRSFASQDPHSPGLAGLLALAFAAKGDWQSVDSLERLVRERPQGRSRETDMAVIRLASGETEPLLRLFETPEGRRLWVTWFYSVSCGPILDPLQANPKFIALMDGLALRRCPATTPWPIKPRPPSSPRTPAP